MGLIKKITLFRVYMVRGMSYIGICNTVLLLALSIKNFDVNLNMKIWLVPLILMSVIVPTFIGFVDYKLGIYKEENTIRSENDYIIKSIKEKNDIQ